jgi:hypothetical protein
MAYDSWKATETSEEREEDRADYTDPPRYRLMFSYPYSGHYGDVLAYLERLEGHGPQSYWLRISEGGGATECEAIKAMRLERYYQRSLARELKHTAAMQREAEARLERIEELRAIDEDHRCLAHKEHAR